MQNFLFRCKNMNNIQLKRPKRDYIYNIRYITYIHNEKKKQTKYLI